MAAFCLYPRFAGLLAVRHDPADLRTFYQMFRGSSVVTLKPANGGQGKTGQRR